MLLGDLQPGDRFMLIRTREKYRHAGRLTSNRKLVVVRPENSSNVSSLHIGCEVKRVVRVRR